MIGPLFTAPKVTGHLAPVQPAQLTPGAYRGALGKVTLTDTPCNAACTHAIGPDCSCSCGGVNHGKQGRVNFLSLFP